LREVVAYEEGKNFTVKEKDRRYGLVAKNGKVLIPFDYEYLYDLKEYRYKATLSDKQFILDTVGKVIAEYGKNVTLDVDGFEGGRMNVGIMDDLSYKNALIDVNGKEIIPFAVQNIFTKLSSAEDDIPHLYMVEQRGKYGFYNRDGKLIIPIDYIDATPCRGGGGLANTQNLWALYDTTGRKTTDFIYYTVKSLGLNRFAVKLTNEDKFRLMDVTGKLICATLFDDVGKIYQWGRLPFKKGSKWGFLDKNGNEVIPAVYDEVVGFSTDNAYVVQGGRSFKIDLWGEETF